ncbi:8858_t:CDS:2 [Paraglomus occultum]|uniref:8858_t:CDS:1 n=1 Tax=Paraglomus occultum TaxID=144539 RepID=A0A9N9CCQ0_9GLOM|nr:8858_t:CDS:2 [Paraglomus occultum]
MRLQGSLVIEFKNDDETCTDEDVDDSESDCDDVIVTEDFDEEESVLLLDSAVSNWALLFVDNYNVQDHIAKCKRLYK